MARYLSRTISVGCHPPVRTYETRLWNAECVERREYRYPTHRVVVQIDRSGPHHYAHAWYPDIGTYGACVRVRVGDEWGNVHARAILKLHRTHPYRDAVGRKVEQWRHLHEGRSRYWERLYWSLSE